MDTRRIKIKNKPGSEINEVASRIRIKANPGSGKRTTKKPLVLIAVSVLIILILVLLLLKSDSSLTDSIGGKLNKAKTSDVISGLAYADQFRIHKGENLVDALYEFHMPDKQISPAVLKFEAVVPSADIVGSLVKLYNNPSVHHQQLLVFTPASERYQVKLGFGDSTFVVRLDRRIWQKSVKRSHLVSYDDFYQSLDRDGFGLMFMGELERALAWTVDFQHIKANSKFRFKAIYEETYADSILISVKLNAIQYEDETANEQYFRFANEEFYDQVGYLARRQFLRAPVEYSRISSTYGSRVHPISGQIKQHNGIDFAAPEGTDIRALSDGVIEIASYTSGNGNYIKIRHDNVYETQYLHMQSFAPGMEVGRQVSQGETIGQVGTTGDSTGPHVCLRFWKNKEQVDFFKEEMPRVKKLSSDLLPQFLQMSDSINRELAHIHYN